MENIKKRKKRKSLVQTVKKKFKKNSMRTLGTRLDADIHEYFLRVFQQSKQEFSDSDERCIFIDNVFSQTEGHEIEFSSNQLVSRIIESFLPECNEIVLQRYLTAFSQDLRPLCCHQFASHVLETLLKIASKKVIDSESNHIMDIEKNVISDKKGSDVYLNFVLKVSKFLLNNIDEFMLDTYANHVTRSAISCLSGKVEKSCSESKNLKYTKECNATSLQLNASNFCPREFKELLHKFAECILNLHMFSEYANNVLLSGLVQSLLLSLQFVKSKKYLKSISLKLLDTIYDRKEKGSDILQILVNQQAVHLLNTMIITSTKTVFENIRCRCFTGRLKDLALSKTANYSVQKLVERCTDIESFSLIYDELSDIFEQIIESYHTGVLFSLSKMCCKLKTKEKSFVKDMMRCLSSDDISCFDKERTNCILRLLTLGRHHHHHHQNKAGADNLEINLHGCLILQEMLKFNKPYKVIKNFLEIELSTFVCILCDQKGSHIADAFFSNNVIKDKYKNKFVEKLKGSYALLALNKYGSFVITAIWNTTDIDQKLLIVKELANKESMLWNSPSGKLIARTVSLETYRHQPREWENAQKQIIYSRQLFFDVIK